MKNIYKLNLLAAGITMAFTGVTHASNLGDERAAANGGVDDLTEIFVGGATAPQNFMREDLMLRVCDKGSAGPVQVFVDNVAVAPGVGYGDGIMSQGDHFVVRCHAPAINGGAEIAVYKFNGGSATGVAPVADPAGTDPGAKIYLDASVGTCAPYSAGGGSGTLGNEYPIGVDPTGSPVFELYECTDPALIKTQDPDAGVSDVEPTLFNGPLALDFGTEPLGVAARPSQPFVDQGNLNIKPGPGLIFGTIVSLPMYNEMGGDQYAAGMMGECEVILGEAGAPTRAAYDGAAQAVRDREECMPGMPSAAITSVFTGQVTDWANLAPYGHALDTSAVQQTNNVHVCKRTNGSGTHAQFSVNYMKTNCLVTSNTSMSEQNDGVSFAGANFVGVYANRGSSDMSDCVDALGNGLGFDGDFDGLPQTDVANFGTGDSSVVPGSGLDPLAGRVQITGGNHPLPIDYDNGGVPFTAYGMGYNSLENNTTFAFDYRFVKVDGAAPTLEDTIAGDYRDVYYLSYQFREAAPDVVDRSPNGDIRDLLEDHPDEQDDANAYFAIWNATAAAAIASVNEGLVHDPDGTPGNGDEWNSGFVTPLTGAAFAYDGSSPATPWSRQSVSGEADSCQELSLVR